MLGQRGVRPRGHLGQEEPDCWAGPILGDWPGRGPGTTSPASSRRCRQRSSVVRWTPKTAATSPTASAGVQLAQGAFAEVAGVLLHPGSVAQDATSSARRSK